MIYMKDKNGNIKNTYGSDSGIKVVLEYKCHYEYDGCEMINHEKTILVACPDDKYAKEYINRHEVLVECINEKSWFGRVQKEWCIDTHEGIFKYWYRGWHKIENNQDYVFTID